MTVPPALVTDLYELTMAAAYGARVGEREATFELFVRSLPQERRFLVAAGLDDALAGLEAWRFDPADVDYLRGLDLFPPDFLERLDDLGFTGEVWAVPEGEIVFQGEPLVRVTAPLVEAQLVETWLLNRIGSQTLLASKAARVALACGDRAFVDFSARRDHGVDAALAAARAAWLAGAAGTSLVAAGRRWGLPLSGTMAHSFVMSFDDERDAFRAYARTFPQGVVLLIDTYDTVEGARRAADVARELAAEGIGIAGVRLDSGDLASLSVEVREILDAAGFVDVDILASGDLDEHSVSALVSWGAPIDAFGIGTQLGTSADAPALGAVYKLVEDATGPKMKLAEGKVTLPGRKQVWRLADRDVVALARRGRPRWPPAAVPVMAGGRRRASEPLARSRERCTAALAALPPELRSLEPAPYPVWPVHTSPGLEPWRPGSTPASTARCRGERAVGHLRRHLRPAARRAPGHGGQRAPRPQPEPGAAGGGRPAVAEARHPGDQLGGRPPRHGRRRRRLGGGAGGERARDRPAGDVLHGRHPGHAAGRGSHPRAVPHPRQRRRGRAADLGRADEVRALATLVVVDRPGARSAGPPPGWTWERVEVPRLEVSSTELRARVAEGRPLDYLLTPEVIATIESRGLYGARVAR